MVQRVRGVGLTKQPVQRYRKVETSALCRGAEDAQDRIVLEKTASRPLRDRASGAASSADYGLALLTPLEPTDLPIAKR